VSAGVCENESLIMFVLGGLGPHEGKRERERFFVCQAGNLC